MDELRLNMTLRQSTDEVRIARRAGGAVISMHPCILSNVCILSDPLYKSEQAVARLVNGAAALV
jgi:hypothetical protein